MLSKPAVNHEMNCPEINGFIAAPCLLPLWPWLVREDAPRRCDTNRLEGLKRSSYYFQVGLYSRTLFLSDIFHYFSIFIFMILYVFLSFHPIHSYSILSKHLDTFRKNMDWNGLKRPWLVLNLSNQPVMENFFDRIPMSRMIRGKLHCTRRDGEMGSLEKVWNPWG